MNNTAMWWGNVNWTHTGKTRLLQLCVYIYFLYIYLHCSYNCHLTKEIQWTEQSSINSPAGVPQEELAFSLDSSISFLRHSCQQSKQRGGIALNSAPSISTPTDPNPCFHFETSPKSKAVWNEWWVEDNFDSSIMLLQWQYSLNFMTCKPGGTLHDHPSEVVTCS